MKGHLRALVIELFCQAVEKQACNTTDCVHLGRSCEAAGCDSRVCRLHENYCSGCGLRYCQGCFEGHLESCPGPAIDGHDQRLEQELIWEPGPQAGERGGSQ